MLEREFFMSTLATERDYMDSRVIRVSRKRQITIPLKFYEALNLGDQVECSLGDGAIIIRPSRRTDDEFSVEILKDLVSKGLSGDELVREFEAERYRVKKAVDRLREEADRIADGVQPAARFDDFFDSED
jgi:bifunctional DNA-binding transcriptional regulator/antitoxin component of YhaV-PrlF toxin-antitoxin module